MKLLIDKFLEKKLEKALHPESIDAALEKVLAHSPKKQYIQNRFAVVQREIKAVRTVDDYVNELYRFVKEASDHRAQYVIFPEYNIFDLLHLIPGLTTLDRWLKRRAKSKGTSKSAGNAHLQSNRMLRQLFSAVSQPTEKALLLIVERLARFFGMYIFTGTYIHKQGKRLFNRGTFFNPAGKVIFSQDKVHLTDFETSIALARGDCFHVFDLPAGKAAVPICMDASYFETFRLLAAKHADIVIVPIANNEPYDKWRAMRGIWGRVQEAYVYGMKASLNGWIGGMEFTGKAGFFAPCELTENFDGILKIADEPCGDEVIVFDLEIERLRQARNDAQYFGDKNETFERTHFAKTYVTKEAAPDAF